jgi:hypothetical protein
MCECFERRRRRRRAYGEGVLKERKEGKKRWELLRYKKK